VIAAERPNPAQMPFAIRTAQVLFGLAVAFKKKKPPRLAGRHAGTIIVEREFMIRGAT